MTPRFRLVFEKEALIDIQRLTPPIRKRMRTKLEFFAEQADPLQFAQRLTEPAVAHYRFRVGDYRVLFDVAGDDIIVLRVRHRREVYRR